MFGNNKIGATKITVLKMDIDNILICSNVSPSEKKKDFIKLNWYIFLFEGDGKLKKYNDTCNKVSSSIKKEFVSKPIYYKNFCNLEQNPAVMRLKIIMK